MKKVVLTGAAGLIGKEALEPLEKSGFEVYSERFDLFDKNAVEEVFRREQPEYLLHFAWVAKDDYLTSELNYKLSDASLDMLKTFKKYVGKRAVFAGTCFEYKFRDEPLKEDGDRAPATIYAQCKNELRICAEEFAAENDLSFGWGRIFYVFGHGEHEKRLTPHVINSLQNNRKVTVNTLIRDYIYTKDIAGAFVKFLDSGVEGSVNICSGKGISVSDFAIKIAEKLGKEHLIEIVPPPEDQPPVIVGDASRLYNEVGYTPQYTIDEALENIICTGGT